jgi:hypothetical protein
LIILSIPLSILSDADRSLAQGTTGNAETIEGDIVTLPHVAFLKFVAANVGAAPIDLRNLFVASLDMHFENAFSARGRALSTTVTPFILTSAYDLRPLGTLGFVIWMV